MGHAALKKGISPAEYLAFERAAEERHEYADGEIFAMAGGTAEHSSVAANLIREIGVSLRGSGCRVFTSDMRIHIPSTGRYTYPDLSVVCGEPRFEDEVRDTLLNPKLIAEVLSDSTEAYYRGEKFLQYRSVPSFVDYLIVSQHKAQIEHFHRLPDESWLLWTFGKGARLLIPSIDCKLAVDDVYENVFPPPAER